MYNWDVELNGVSDAYRKQIFNGIEIMRKDFPLLKEIPFRISTQWYDEDNPSTIRPERYNNTYQHVIYLSAYYFKNGYKLSQLRNSDQNRFLENFSSVMIHELGHILQDLYCSKSMLLCKIIRNRKFYFKYIRSKNCEERFLERVKRKVFKFYNLDLGNCSYYLGENSVSSIYELFADCFNTYYYLLGEDTASREGTREYYAFKIAEYTINLMKRVLNKEK